jgi:hypothetical protein
MIRCWKLRYILPIYPDLILYKFTDDEGFESPVDATDLSKDSGYFLTDADLAALKRNILERFCMFYDGQLTEDRKDYIEMFLRLPNDYEASEKGQNEE